MAIIGIALFLAVLIQLILFIPAYGYKTDKLTDLSYALTFIILALLLFIFNKFSGGKLVLFIMITLWAIRLGSYLFRRIHHMGRDARFDGIRENFFRFMGFWLLQGVTIWIIIIPAAFYFDAPAKFTFLTVLGLIIWLKGLVIETVADHQKFVFKIDKLNANKWIDTGLWKYSRHPNYFGEILCWFGIYIYAVSALSGYNILIALISPVFIALLLLYYSGVPGLEKSADARFGNDRRYRHYKKNTSILFILPPKDHKFKFKKRKNPFQRKSSRKSIKETYIPKMPSFIIPKRSKGKAKQKKAKPKKIDVQLTKNYKEQLKKDRKIAAKLKAERLHRQKIRRAKNRKLFNKILRRTVRTTIITEEKVKEIVKDIPFEVREANKKLQKKTKKISKNIIKELKRDLKIIAKEIARERKLIAKEIAKEKKSVMKDIKKKKKKMSLIKNKKSKQKPNKKKIIIHHVRKKPAKKSSPKKKVVKKTTKKKKKK